MRFYIKIKDADKYIYTEIDPGGMSAWLVNKDRADYWDTREDAERFVQRLAEPASKFRNDSFEIIQ